MATPPYWRIKCHARAKSTGRRCGRWAIRGGRVCTSHGGNAPQVRAKAEVRLIVWKAERKLVRKLGRPLTPAELAYLAGDMAGYRREVRRQLSQMRADAQEALIRLRNSLET